MRDIYHSFMIIVNISIQQSCAEKGFSDTLLCSSCNDLEQYVPDKGISHTFPHSFHLHTHLTHPPTSTSPAHPHPHPHTLHNPPHSLSSSSYLLLSFSPSHPPTYFFPFFPLFPPSFITELVAECRECCSAEAENQDVCTK